MSASLPNMQNASGTTTDETLIVRKGQEAEQEEQLALPYRHREIEWLRTHKEAVQKLAGQWIVVEGEEIIAHGHDPAPVVIDAQAKGIKVPYLFYVDKLDKNVARIGL